MAEGYLRSSQISSTSDCLLLIPEEKEVFAFKGGEGSTAENSDHIKVLHIPKTVNGSSKNDAKFPDKRLKMP